VAFIPDVVLLQLGFLSSLFGQLDDEQVLVIARRLDAVLEHALRQAAE